MSFSHPFEVPDWSQWESGKNPYFYPDSYRKYERRITSEYKRRKCHLRRNPKLWRLNSNRNILCKVEIYEIDHSIF